AIANTLRTRRGALIAHPRIRGRARAGAARGILAIERAAAAHDVALEEVLRGVGIDVDAQALVLLDAVLRYRAFPRGDQRNAAGVVGDDVGEDADPRGGRRWAWYPSAVADIGVDEADLDSMGSKPRDLVHFYHEIGVLARRSDSLGLTVLERVVFDE